MLIKRRSLLRGMAMTPMLLKGMSAEAAGSNDNILVVIYLNGGNDGLGTVIPLTQYGEYYKLRTPVQAPAGLNMAYPEADLQTLAFNADPSVSALNATEFAFAPGAPTADGNYTQSMVAMRDLYATGNLAVITGVSLPLAEMNAFSHYNATLDWMTGQINIGLTTPPGWLGLTLNGVSSGKLGPTLSVGGTTPMLVNANGDEGLVVYPPMDGFGVSYGISDDEKKLAGAFRGIGVLPPLSASGLSSQAVLQTALADITTLQGFARKDKAPDYPQLCYLDTQMRDIARLIVTGSGMRGYFAQLGGFDTHSSQMLYQPTILAQLGQSIVNFYEYLTAAGAAAGTSFTKNVTIMTVSDFGRRPYSNLDFGTDHGAASVSFVFGDQVKGGTYFGPSGAYPSLKKFDVNGNLALGIDFRNLFSDIITHMGGNAVDVLGLKTPYTPIGFI